MSEYKEIIFNVATGEVTERPYTEKEIAEVKMAEQQAIIFEEKMAAKIAIRQSELAKLTALGLTEDEIAAL